MVPLGTLVDVEKRLGPQIITRYNLYPSASITGEAAPGFSSGEALRADGADGRREAARRRWATSGRRCRTRRSRSAAQAIYVFALAVLLVYLVLAAQYESWSCRSR